MRLRAAVWSAAVSSVALCLASGVPVLAAQGTSTAEAFGAYSYLHETGGSFHGWDASLTWNLGRLLGIEGDVAGHFGGFEGSDASVLAYLAGPRLSWRRSGLTPFLHALAGGVRNRESISIGSVTIAETRTDLGALVGGGLDLPRGRWGARVQGGYLLVRSDGKTNGDPRLSAGVTLRLGGR